MTPDQLREAYLAFFEARGHARHPSDRLVPENDPTLLFSGAGMNQFKAMFLGKGNLPFRRATTSQKCLRMPDLENVGRTASHHTFFEMLGNFSFGDYFKAEAIAWAWEFLMQVGIPGDRLSVTVYTDDDEAFALWRDAVGLPAERIFRCGEDDNFWPASAPSQGPNGICGPCSEIYFDFHPEQGPLPTGGPSTDGRRFVEIWNLVFTQFDRRDGGELRPLPARNIDTGMGFERAVRVVESVSAGTVVPSNFETALFAPLLAAIHEHIGRTTRFGEAEGTRVRRIADHVRAATFCIADGVRPGNERQGYVVRKVLRRAMLDRHLLGGNLREPWLAELSGGVVALMGRAWPEVAEAASTIAATIAAEEERFAETFLAGSQKLAVLTEELRQRGTERLGGAEAFLLYDTFGLPLDSQKQLLEPAGLGLDEEGFQAAMAEQRRRSREGSRISDSIFDEGPLGQVAERLPATEFVYDTLQLEDAEVLAVVPDDESGEGGAEGEELARRVIAVLRRTPFYAEGGGQVGDAGRLEGPPAGPDGAPAWRIAVDDTVALRGISLHRGVVLSGQPVAGPARARVDGRLRGATARNHTGTHLLHAALREVLGEDVTQAGSLVTPERLRFDFRFARALTDSELAAIEDLVNARILRNTEVCAEQMPRDEARRQGAVALFGEKYGEVVRVVRVPDEEQGRHSVELCGGTHVRRSGDIGLLRILSESGIAAGIRRIEARTGLGVLDLLRTETGTLRQTASLLKAAPELLVERVGNLQEELRNTRRERDELRERVALERLQGARRLWRGLTLLATPVEGVPLKALRELAGNLVKRDVDLVLLTVSEPDGTSYLVAAGKRAQSAGQPASALGNALAAALAGKGGGSAAFAQGRGAACADPQALIESVLQELAASES